MTSEEIILSALRLARERVTGGDLHEKLDRKREIGDLEARVILWGDQPGDKMRPTAAALREVLDDLGNRELREALDAWDG